MTTLGEVFALDQSDPIVQRFFFIDPHCTCSHLPEERRGGCQFCKLVLEHGYDAVKEGYKRWRAMT
jgi:hypothetical protein